MAAQENTITIKARSVRDKFRRAGLDFTKGGGTYKVNQKTLDILKAEPSIIVEVLPEEKPKETKEPEKEKATGKEKDGKDKK